MVGSPYQDKAPSFNFSPFILLRCRQSTPHCGRKKSHSSVSLYCVCVCRGGPLERIIFQFALFYFFSIFSLLLPLPWSLYLIDVSFSSFIDYSVEKKCIFFSPSESNQWPATLPMMWLIRTRDRWAETGGDISFNFPDPTSHLGFGCALFYF